MLTRKTYIHLLTTTNPLELLLVRGYYAQRFSDRESSLLRRNPFVSEQVAQMLFFLQGMGWFNSIDQQMGSGKGDALTAYLTEALTAHWENICKYYKVAETNTNPQTVLDAIKLIFIDQSPSCSGDEDFPHTPAKFKFFSPLDPSPKFKVVAPRWVCDYVQEDGSTCGVKMTHAKALDLMSSSPQIPCPFPLPSPLAEVIHYWQTSNGMDKFEYLGLQDIPEGTIVVTKVQTLDPPIEIEAAGEDDLPVLTIPGANLPSDPQVGPAPNSEGPAPVESAGSGGGILPAGDEDLPSLPNLPTSQVGADDDLTAGYTDAIFSSPFGFGPAKSGVELADIVESNETLTATDIRWLKLPLVGTPDARTPFDGCTREQYRGPGAALSDEATTLARNYFGAVTVQLHTGLWDIAQGNIKVDPESGKPIYRTRFVKDPVDFYGNRGIDPALIIIDGEPTKSGWVRVKEPTPDPKGNVESRYEWQKEALERWATGDNGWCKFKKVSVGTSNERPAPYNGIVEACTGSGKTKFAIKCLKRLFKDKGKDNVTVTIVCPPLKEVQMQWFCELQETLEGEPGFNAEDIALFGGEFGELVRESPRRLINLYVVNTASGTEQSEEKKEAIDYFEIENLKFQLQKEEKNGKKHFLLVDETHRPSPTARQFTKIFNNKIDYALLLTGTMIDGYYIRAQCTVCKQVDPETNKSIPKSELITNKTFKTAELFLATKVKDADELIIKCRNELSGNENANHQVIFPEQGTFLDYYQKKAGPSLAFFTYPEALNSKNISPFRVWFVNTPRTQAELDSEKSTTLLNGIEEMNATQELEASLQNFSRDVSERRAHELVRIIHFALQQNLKVLTFNDRTAALKVVHRYLIDSFKKHENLDVRKLIGAHHSALSPYFGEIPVIQRIVVADSAAKNMVNASGTKFVDIPAPRIEAKLIGGLNSDGWHEGVLAGDSAIKIVLDDIKNSASATTAINFKWLMCQDKHLLMVNHRLNGLTVPLDTIAEKGDMIGAGNPQNNEYAYIKKIYRQKLTAEQFQHWKMTHLIEIPGKEGVPLVFSVPTSAMLSVGDVLEAVSLDRALPCGTNLEWNVRLTIHPKIESGVYYPAVPVPLQDKKHRRNHSITFGNVLTSAAKNAIYNTYLNELIEKEASKGIKIDAAKKKTLSVIADKLYAAKLKELSPEKLDYTKVEAQETPNGGIPFKKVYTLELEKPLKKDYPPDYSVALSQVKEIDIQKLMNSYIEEFRGANSAVQVMLSGRSLIEGVDVPNVDIGIALSPASNRNSIPNLQSLGRILRVRPGKTVPKDYIVFYEAGPQAGVIPLFQRALMLPQENPDQEGNQYICEMKVLDYTEFFSEFSQSYGIKPFTSYGGEIKLDPEASYQEIATGTTNSSLLLTDVNVDFAAQDVEYFYRVILKPKPDANPDTWRTYNIRRSPKSEAEKLHKQQIKNKIQELVDSGLSKKEASQQANIESAKPAIHELVLSQTATVTDYVFMDDYNKSSSRTYLIEKDFPVDRKLLQEKIFQSQSPLDFGACANVKPEATVEMLDEISVLDLKVAEIEAAYNTGNFVIPPVDKKSGAPMCEICGKALVGDHDEVLDLGEYYHHLVDGSDENIFHILENGKKAVKDFKKSAGCIGRRKLEVVKDYIKKINDIVDQLRLFEFHNPLVIDLQRKTPVLHSKVMHGNFCLLRKLRLTSPEAYFKKLEELSHIVPEKTRGSTGQYTFICFENGCRKGRGRPASWYNSLQDARDQAAARQATNQAKGKVVICYILDGEGRIFDVGSGSETPIIPAPKDLLNKIVVNCGAFFAITTSEDEAIKKMEEFYHQCGGLCDCTATRYDIIDGVVTGVVIAGKGTGAPQVTKSPKNKYKLSDKPYSIWKNLQLTDPYMVMKEQLGFDNWKDAQDYLVQSHDAGIPLFTKVQPEESSKSITFWCDPNFEIKYIRQNKDEEFVHVGSDSVELAVAAAHKIEKLGSNGPAIFLKGLPARCYFFSDHEFKNIISVKGEPLSANTTAEVKDALKKLASKHEQVYVYDARGKLKRFLKLSTT